MLQLPLFLDETEFSIATLNPYSDNQSDAESEHDGMLYYPFPFFDHLIYDF
jgi:hypothetical protein